MNTRQLRHFLAVMDHRSLSAAADVVNLSQSALSRSLRALEDALRVPLFDRSEGRLHPTPYAHAYAERARRLVFEEREGERTITLMRTGHLGPLSFGMGSTLTASFLSQLLLHMLDGSPTLQMRTVTKTSDVLIEELERERIDFFVGDIRAAEGCPWVEVEALFPCTCGWFARAEHPLARTKGISFGSLERFPIISGGFLEDAMMRRMARLYGLTLPMTDHFTVTTDDLATMLSVMAGSDAVSASTDYAMIGARLDGRVTRLSVVPPLDLDMTLGIVRRTGRTQPPAAEKAFAFVREHFTDAATALKGLQRAD